MTEGAGGSVCNWPAICAGLHDATPRPHGMPGPGAEVAGLFARHFREPSPLENPRHSTRVVEHH